MGTTAPLNLQIAEDQREHRVLISAPSGRDAEALSRTLDDAGIVTTVCSTLEELCREMQSGAAAAVLAEEILTTSSRQTLVEALSHQPEWSDLPLIVMVPSGKTQDGSWQSMAGIEAATSIVFLERPVRKRTLLSSVRAAMKARARQYQVGAELIRRRKAEEALRRSEGELADFFENASIAVHWVGPDGRILRANRKELEMLGYCSQEYVGHHIAEFHADPSVVEEAMARLANGETLVDYPARMRRKDGEIRSVLVNSNALFHDGNLLRSRCFTRDVTELKHAQEAQILLAAIVESSEDAILSKSLDGIIQSWNVGAERLYGYTPQEAVGRYISLIVPPDRAAEEEEILSRIRAGQRIQHFESVRLRKDGRSVPVSLTISPVRDGSGHVVGASAIARDMTTYRQSEQALRESQERYELIIAGAEAAIWDWDVPGNRVVYSPRWKELRGLSDAEVSDRVEEWSNRIHPDDVDRVMAAVRAHLEGQTKAFSEEYRVRHKHGHWVWVLDRGLAKRDESGQVVRMAGSETDITTRKVAEEALRESEARFRTLADSSPVLIWVNGLDGCEFVNRAYLDYLGVKLAEVEKFNWADFVHPEDRDTYVNAYLISFAKRELFTAQFRFRRFDGEYRWMKVAGLPRFSGSGEFQGYVGSTLDITDIKEAEAALHESDRHKDEFLAMLGHELRNPLAAISTGTTLLQSDPAPERRAWIEEMIARQVRQLQRLVDDLLDVSRITRGKIELRKAHLPLRKLLEGCVAAVEDLMNQRRHQISVSMPAQELYVEADPARLEQMVVNLLTNAAKYTPQGGRVWLSAEQADHEVIICCRDTGVGLSPDTLEAVFELFAQLDTSPERTSGGLGVGLALVKALAEMHGGSVTASSDGLGTGSEFLLRVPAATGAQLALSTTEASVANEPKRPLKILVVDDNCDLAEGLAFFLRNAGHQVSVAHDGETAIPAALEERPEVVLLDIGLPDIDGFAVAERLRASTDLKKTTIIAVSGWKVQEQAEAARIRFDAQLVKPVDHEQLAALLQAITTQLYGD